MGRRLASTWLSLRIRRSRFVSFKTILVDKYAMETFEMRVLERDIARLVASGQEQLPARFAVNAVKFAVTADLLVSNVNVELECDKAISVAMHRDTVFPPLYFLVIARDVLRS